MEIFNATLAWKLDEATEVGRVDTEGQTRWKEGPGRATGSRQWAQGLQSKSMARPDASKGTAKFGKQI